MPSSAYFHPFFTQNFIVFSPFRNERAFPLPGKLQQKKNKFCPNVYGGGSSNSSDNSFGEDSCDSSHVLHQDGPSASPPSPPSFRESAATATARRRLLPSTSTRSRCWKVFAKNAPAPSDVGRIESPHFYFPFSSRERSKKNFFSVFIFRCRSNILTSCY